MGKNLYQMKKKMSFLLFGQMILTFFFQLIIEIKNRRHFQWNVFFFCFSIETKSNSIMLKKKVH